MVYGKFRTVNLEIIWCNIHSLITVHTENLMPVLLYNCVKKCPNKYTSIFRQLVICIAGNRFDILTCAKHNKRHT